MWATWLFRRHTKHFEPMTNCERVVNAARSIRHRSDRIAAPTEEDGTTDISKHAPVRREWELRGVTMTKLFAGALILYLNLFWIIGEAQCNTKVRVAVPGWLQLLAFATAKERGYYKDEGLDV